MPITLERLHPLFVAEIAGVDLTRPLDDATQGEIRAAFEEHSVLVFREQRFDDDSQAAFSRRFGPLERTIGTNAGGGTEIVRISNVDAAGNLMPPEDRYMRYLSGNELWHSDSSFKPVPALASLLSGREVPPEGGATEFATMRGAWDALPERRRRLIEPLVCEHSFAFSRSKVAPDTLSEAQRAEFPPVLQALVRGNPINGRKALFAGSHASRIVGWPDDAGRRLIEELVAFATQPRFVYRHEWRPYDAVMWDNRAVLHRGTAWDKARHRRVMHRTTVAGDRPTVDAAPPAPGDR